MAWVSVHQPIRDHRKTRDLFRTLNIKRAEAVGTLTLLWTWAIDNCDKNGKLLSCTIDDIAAAAYWDGDPNTLYDALVKTGWIDEKADGMYLHDWYDFNKQFYTYIDRKDKDKQRKRAGNYADIPPEYPEENPPENSAEFHDSHSPAHSHSHEEIRDNISAPRGAVNFDYQGLFDFYLSLDLIKHKELTPEMKNAIDTARRRGKYSWDMLKTMLERHAYVVKLTKGQGQYEVQKRSITKFFGQRIQGGQELICSEYADDGAKWLRYKDGLQQQGRASPTDRLHGYFERPTENYDHLAVDPFAESTCERIGGTG